MKIEFDSAKSRKNARERNLPFYLAEEFEWETALYREDDRREYPERRFVAVGSLESGVHVICFTPTSEGVRIISLRRANHREVRRYEKETADR
ncbi:MAG: BrnT family toxin [SAR324 cluster bacterium]|nr:BrnT family toxin [SAR324 cluster bacterium]